MKSASLTPEQLCVAVAELNKYRWWYKGITPEGNTCRFEGTGWAVDSREAIRNIETMMRTKYPEIKWMQGREIEGENVQFGPTVQMLKTKKQPNAAALSSQGFGISETI